ncbi:MAG: tol-pal system protein YbgF [Rhizobiaceae bacterium]
MKTILFLPALLLGTALANAAPGLGGDTGLRPPLPVGDVMLQGATKPAGAFEMAQNADATVRMNQLEESNRALNGRIEELNFQLLQLQEQIRKMQEDNEFRFQELEQKGDAGGNGAVTAQKETPQTQGDANLGKSQPSEQDTSAQRSDGNSIARIIEGTGGETPAVPGTIDGVEIFKGEAGAGEESSLPQNLGSLTFDADGNLVDSNIERPIDLTGRSATGSNGAAPQAGALLPDDPEQLYQLGYTYVQSGDYELAGQTFEEFSDRFPDHARLPEARFWLGESLLARGLNDEAAKVYLEAHRNYPDSRFGAQTLLKLGVALNAMQQRELACATFAEVPKKYPGISNALVERVAAEQLAANCKAG